MATKKQKRLAALAKRAKFEEEERQRGLEFQRKGREEEARRKEARKARQEREEREAAKQKKIDDDLASLIAMMSASMRRFPTDQEVHDFIMGDEATRDAILSNKTLEGSE